MRTSRQNSDNPLGIIGHPDSALPSGAPRHSEGIGFQSWRPDLEQRYISRYGFGDFGQATATATDPITSIVNVLGPTMMGAIAIGAAIYFLFIRKEEHHD